MKEYRDENALLFSGEFTERLLGLARIAEKVAGPDAVFTAFLAAGVAYAVRHGIPEADVRAHLRALADKLEVTAPPAPTVN